MNYVSVRNIDQYKLGKMLYYCWRTQENEESYEVIRNLGRNNVNLALLKRGFIEERRKFVQDNEDEECFYGAMDEVGVEHW